MSKKRQKYQTLKRLKRWRSDGEKNWKASLRLLESSTVKSVKGESNG